MRYLLDTDHLSILQRQTGAAYDTLRTRLALAPPDHFGCSVISFHEQILGCHAYINQAQKPADIVRGYAMLNQALRDFVRLPVVPFDLAAQQMFLQFRAQRIRVSTMDLRIASTACAHHLTLLTRNLHDFGQIPNVQVEDWTRH